MSSTMSYNEYIIASNNSINDNKYNAQKMAKSPSHKLKRMLKPILRMLRNQKSNNNNNKSNKKTIDDNDYAYDNHKNTSIENGSGCCSSNTSGDNFWGLSEVDDNSANEELESRIFREIEQCPVDAAVYVYDDDYTCELQSVERDQKFVPVHFARTEAGTFFWTTMQKPVDYELVQPTYCCSEFQQPELQFGDRWVQA